MKHTSIIVAVGLALIAALSAAPANALAGRTFVSPTGSDSNPCTLALPCRNLQAALYQTNPGGEIAILGTAGYSGGATLTIDMAISIVNPGAFEAGIIAPSGGNGIVVSAGATDAVSLRGLTIDGQGAGQNGVVFNSGQSLTIKDSTIRGTLGFAVDFIPTGSSALTISNTVVADTPATEANGIYIAPQGANQATQVFINHVQVYNVPWGIFFDATHTTGGTLDGSIVDSVITRSNFDAVGVFSYISNPVTHVSLLRVTANKNHTGLDVQGGEATTRLASSSLSQNDTGWTQATNSLVFSYGNNFIDANTAGNMAPSPISMK